MAPQIGRDAVAGPRLALHGSIAQDVGRPQRLVARPPALSGTSHRAIPGRGEARHLAVRQHSRGFDTVFSKRGKRANGAGASS